MRKYSDRYHSLQIPSNAQSNLSPFVGHLKKSAAGKVHLLLSVCIRSLVLSPENSSLYLSTFPFFSCVTMTTSTVLDRSSPAGPVRTEKRTAEKTGTVPHQSLGGLSPSAVRVSSNSRRAETKYREYKTKKKIKQSSCLTTALPFPFIWNNNDMLKSLLITEMQVGIRLLGKESLEAKEQFGGFGQNQWKK